MAEVKEISGSEAMSIMYRNKREVIFFTKQGPILYGGDPEGERRMVDLSDFMSMRKFDYIIAYPGTYEYQGELVRTYGPTSKLWNWMKEKGKSNAGNS